MDKKEMEQEKVLLQSYIDAVDKVLAKAAIYGNILDSGCVEGKAVEEAEAALKAAAGHALECSCEMGIT